MTVFVRHPVDNPRITQPFGAKNTWEAQPHMGVDYGAPEGAPIYAPCDGFVVWASFDVFRHGNTWEMIAGSGNSGGCVIIQPPAPHTALQTSFSHMSAIYVKPGQWVTAGTMIGRVGNTGFSFGAHLHWEAFIDYAEGVYPAGTYWGRVNPLDYFNTATVVPVSNTGGKGSPNIQEEDDMATPEEIWSYRTTVRGKKEQAIDVLAYANQYASDANNAAHRAEAKAEAAINAVAGLLSIQVPHPFEEGKTYALVDYIRYGNAFAGQAADAAKTVMANSDPTAIAEAVTKAAGNVNAQAIIDQVQVTLNVKEK